MIVGDPAVLTVFNLSVQVITWVLFDNLNLLSIKRQHFSNEKAI